MESINTPKSDNKNINEFSFEEPREKIYTRKENLIKSKCIKILIIAIVITVVCIIIGLSLYFALNSKKQKQNQTKNDDETNIIKDNETKDDEKSENDGNKNIKEILPEYSFTATYKSKGGKSIKIFNPLRFGLQKGDYFIYESTKGSKLRRIDEIEENNGEYTSTRDGYVNIKVNFTNPLPNLDFMFEGCEDLIDVNLSQINSSIDSMIYTFTNCHNLQQVDISSVDTSNVTSMDFLFAGCENLIELEGFEDLNTTSVQKTAGMFVDCESLINVNLSHFDLDNITESSGMFINNPSLHFVDLGNCTDANDLFSTQSDFNVTILTRENNEDILNVSLFEGEIQIVHISIINQTLFGASISCEIGEGRNCVECDEEKAIFCKRCNKGYYLPPINRLRCEKCGDGCNDCELDQETNLIICNSCDEGYKLFEGKCKKDCEKGENEKCLECKTEIGENDQCLSCNEGYYFDINYNKSICKRIEIENCLKANFEHNNLTCVNCSRGYMLYNNICEKACDIGENEKCKSCNPTFEQKEFCESCNSGYYLDKELDPRKCHSCGINNEYCDICQRINGNLTCISCKEGYTLINDTCFKDCDENCEDCYFDGVKEGVCLKCKETYFLKNNYYLEDGHLYINMQNCSKCPEGCSKCFDYYIGSEKISLNCTVCSNGYLLTNSICEKYCDIGDDNLCLTCNYKEKNKCATCNKGYFLDKEYGTCHSCEVDNCTNCYNSGNCSKCIDNYETLNGKCYKTCKKGDNEKCLECNNTIFQISENCLKCNEHYFLPEDTNDKTKCSPCEIGCLNCYGKMNESVCYKCMEGYQLYNNKCNDKCILGAGELCKTCDSGNNELNCLLCNDGYYLPNNITERKRCKKCKDDMVNCHQNENGIIIPDNCYYPFLPSGRFCMKKCITGYSTNCDSCSAIPEQIDKCAKCLSGYYLPDNYSNKTKCYYCGGGCKYCNGTSIKKTCTECWSNYVLFNGKCIPNCYTSNYGYDCKSCDPLPGRNDRCLTCNEGYYLPTYSTDIYYRNTICQECPYNCKNCSGDYNNPVCHECYFNYHLKNGKCIENCKNFIYLTNCDKDSCFESEDSETYANCTKCNDGYYLPKIRKIDENYNVCYKCSIPGCIKCEGDNNVTNICLECEINANPVIDNNTNTIKSCYQECEIGEYGKCKSCQNSSHLCGDCNEGYILNEGKCKLNYNIYAKYKTTTKNENVKFMNSNSILKLKINGTIISNNYYGNNYTFKNPGEHNVYINLRSIDVFSHLFTDITKLIYIEFSDNFDSSRISYMNDCFRGCTNLISIDMSKLDLSNNRCFMNFFKGDRNLEDVQFPTKPFHKIYWFYRLFEGCEKLKSVDMSSVYNDNGEYYYNMFFGCKSLEEVKLSNFRKPYRGYYKYNMFVGVPKNITIIIHPGFYSSIQDQLINFESVWTWD